MSPGAFTAAPTRFPALLCRDDDASDAGPPVHGPCNGESWLPGGCDRRASGTCSCGDARAELCADDCADCPKLGDRREKTREGGAKQNGSLECTGVCQSRLEE